MTQDELQEIFDRVEKVASKAPGTGNDDCDAVLHYDAPLLAAEAAKMLAAMSAARLFLLRTDTPDLYDDTDTASLVRKVLERHDQKVVRLDQELQYLKRENAELTEANTKFRQMNDGLASNVRHLLEENGKLEAELEPLLRRKAKKGANKAPKKAQP